MAPRRATSSPRGRGRGRARSGPQGRLGQQIEDCVHPGPDGIEERVPAIPFLETGVSPEGILQLLVVLGVRRVVSARWDEVGEPDRRLLRFEITANAFCHQMVRSIAGTLVEVGLGKRSAGSLMGTLRACDRATAGQLAPPHGLCLWEVGYP